MKGGRGEGAKRFAKYQNKKRVYVCFSPTADITLSLSLLRELFSMRIFITSLNTQTKKKERAKTPDL